MQETLHGGGDLTCRRGGGEAAPPRTPHLARFTLHEGGEAGGGAGQGGSHSKSRRHGPIGVTAPYVIYVILCIGPIGDMAPYVIYVILCMLSI